MRRLLLIFPTAAILAAMTGCGEEEHSYVASITDPAKTPTMSTTNVRTLISDSGYTRYNITTPLWDIYDEVDDPFWLFPRGLELQQYDLNMHPQASMRCDSAKYLSQKRLWRLDGHVVMINTLRDTFMTSQVYWDQMQQKVYGDSFVHIVRQNHIIEGYGFESNQTMTAYTINRPTAIIPITDRKKTNPSATPSPIDTVAENSTRPSASSRQPNNEPQ